MPYKRSSYRLQFEEEVGSLVQRVKAAQKLQVEHNLLRDMVFQCAVFRTSASIETYIKLVIESWFQSLRVLNRGDRVPQPARSYFASQRLQRSFQSFFYNNDEQILIGSFAQHTAVWHVLLGEAQLPSYFDGKLIHSSISYPSYKNLKRLFGRIGINDFEARLGGILRRDVETLIEIFKAQGPL